MPTKIGERIQAALLDRSISKQDVAELIATAKAERKFTPELKGELVALLKQPADRFADGAQKDLADFLGSVNTVRDLPDPAVLSKHSTSVEWKPVAPGGALYVDSVSFDDVIQGSVGDCYLMGAFSSVAKVNPKAIEEAIRDNGDGTFNVRFFEKNAAGKYVAVTKIVDNDLPIEIGSSSKYAKARDPKERWVSVLEKGYAIWKGSFDAIGNGGYSGAVFEALTARPATFHSIKSTGPDQVFKKATEAMASGRAVTASTYPKDGGVNYVGTGVYGHHCYSMLGTSQEGTQRYVTLRNPWGSHEPGRDDKDDGIFKMKLEDFVKLYSAITIGG